MSKPTWTVWENESSGGGIGYDDFLTEAAALKFAAKKRKKPDFGVTSISVFKVVKVAHYDLE